MSAQPDPWHWRVPEDGPDCTCDGCLDSGETGAQALTRHDVRGDVVDSVLAGGPVRTDLTTAERRVIVTLAHRDLGWSLRRIERDTGISQARRHLPENRERVAARQRAYRQANRKRHAAYQRAYYQANREKEAARKRAYRQAAKTPCIDCGTPSGGTRCKSCNGRHLHAGGRS